MPRTPQRRQHTHQLIDHLLNERESMLMLLWKVSGRNGALPHAPEPQQLADFISVLVDYVAASHFGLYQRLSEGTERRRAVREVAAEVYDRILESTDQVLAFNERYGDRRDAHLDPRLAEDAVRLAEALAERVALEDRIIAALLDQAPAGQ